VRLVGADLPSNGGATPRLRGKAAQTYLKSVTHLTIVFTSLTRPVTGLAPSILAFWRWGRCSRSAPALLPVSLVFLTELAPQCYAAPVQLPLRKALRGGFGAPSENSLSHRTKNFRAVNAAETRITSAVGMRHQTENVAGTITNASNVFDRPVWVRFRAR
jgi:hypothetical protein